MKNKMVALLAGAMLMMATSAMAVPLPQLSYTDNLTMTNGVITSQYGLTTTGSYANGQAFGLPNTATDSITGQTLTMGINNAFIATAASSLAVGGTTPIPVSGTIAFQITNAADTATYLSGTLFNIVYTPIFDGSGLVDPTYSANLENITINNTINSQYLTQMATAVANGNDQAATFMSLTFSPGLSELINSGSGSTSITGTVAPVPEPGTMVLLGCGMLGLAIYGKRRMNKEA